MLVRFTKASPVSPSDFVSCIRDNGTETRACLHRDGLLPELAAHFVVETTLGLSAGMFGLVARGTSLEVLTGQAAASERLPAQLEQAAALVAILRAEQWSGAGAFESFLEKLAAESRRRDVPPLDVASSTLDALRAGMRSFGAEWRPLAPGRSLERSFTE